MTADFDCKELPAAAGVTAAKDKIGVGAYMIAGFSVISVFFVGFLGWAAIAPLDSAAIAVGTVKVHSNRKTVQHLEGGIIETIKVRDGDTVAVGDILVTLDETQARATLELYRGRRISLSALEARLIAERDGANEIEFPAWLRDVDVRNAAEKAMRGQAATLRNNRDTLGGESDILRQQIAQLHQEIKGLTDRIDAETQELGIVSEDEKSVRALLGKGYAQKPRLRQLQRDAARLAGSIAQHKSMIAQIRQRISETRLKISHLQKDFRERTLQKLQEVHAQLSDVTEHVRSASHILKRTKIVAPISGTIVNAQVHTAGGVVAPGAALMEIVPSGDKLIVEAKVNPLDIDVIHKGLPARVRFTAFSQRNLLPVEGTVTDISADSLIDDQTGAAYYLARIALEKDYRGKIDGAKLYPGMQTEVMITTGERTALDYFLKPIEDSFRRAMTDS